MSQENERRRAKRHIANPTLLLQGETLDVKNISSTGIGFFYNGNLKPGEVYTIDLIYPSEEDLFDGVQVQLEISIRYCKQDDVSGKTLVGAQFENLDEKKKEILTSFTTFLQQFNTFWGIDWQP